MHNFYSIWHWLQGLAHLDNLTNVITIVGIISWTLIVLGIMIRIVYKIFCKAQQTNTNEPSQRLRSNQKYPAKGSSDSPEINFQITFEQLQEFLKARDEELERDLERMAANVLACAVLEDERDLIRKKRRNPGEAFNQLKEKLAVAHRGLGDFQGEFGPYRITQARQAIEKAEPGPAIALLMLALEQRPEKQAEAGYLLGVLAESRIDFIAAAHYYANAAAIQPANLAYLSAAAGMAYFVRDYIGSEQHLRNALQIQEKLLGSEHPEVAQILSRLAAAYAARNRYEEAVALYQWSLEIIEKSLGAEDPRVVTVMREYAGLLRKMGREEEALALETRDKSGLAQDPGMQPT